MAEVQDLDYYIKKSGLKVSFIYKTLGISDTAFYRRKDGITQFKASEIATLIDLLHIPTEAIHDVFFKKYVGRKADKRK